MANKKIIYLGSDHAGVKVKKKVEEFLTKKGIAYVDYGSFDPKSKDDYPDYAIKVAKKVASDDNALGVLICGSGTGMAIAANKIKGVRAAMAYDLFSAKKAKEHNDVNILTLRARKFLAGKAVKLVDVWLKTKASTAARHRRRIAKIKRVEVKR